MRFQENGLISTVIFSNGRVLRKVEVYLGTLLVIALVWKGKSRFPKGESHPLIMNSNMRLAALDW